MDLMSTAQLLGNFGEFFGAIAVVATLMYLTVQVRQNTTMLRSQARRQVLEGVTTDTDRYLRPENLDVSMKQFEGETLTEQEGARARGLALSYLGNLEIQYHEIQDGTLDPIFEDTLRFRVSLVLDAGDSDWEQNRHFFTRKFQDYVEGLRKAGKPKEFSEASFWYSSMGGDST